MILTYVGLSCYISLVLFLWLKAPESIFIISSWFCFMQLIWMSLQLWYMSPQGLIQLPLTYKAAHHCLLCIGLDDQDAVMLYVVVSPLHQNWFKHCLITFWCSIPMGMTVVLGLHKFILQASIDHHRPSMYIGHYTTSINCCKMHSIATAAQLWRLKWLMP